MSEQPKDGGDISSGFGDPTVTGPVSDEKAEEMLHQDEAAQASPDPADEIYAVGGEGTPYTETDVATNEQDLIGPDA